MVSDDSPRPNDCNMIDLSAIMAQRSSDHACAKDGYFKRHHPTIIDGDMWSDSGWFLGGFGVVGHLTRD
jgi:hypothetical protein